jgi:hypothetical protein
LFYPDLTATLEKKHIISFIDALELKRKTYKITCYRLQSSRQNGVINLKFTIQRRLNFKPLPKKKKGKIHCPIVLFPLTQKNGKKF